jgi:hypothetical protein
LTFTRTFGLAGGDGKLGLPPRIEALPHGFMARGGRPGSRSSGGREAGRWRRRMAVRWVQITRLVPVSEGGSRPKAVIEPCRQAGRKGRHPKLPVVGYGSTV